MSKISDFLNRYDFRVIRLGSAVPIPKLSGPGIVVIACEMEPEQNEVLYRAIDGGEANDPVVVAMSMLKQPSIRAKCDGYLVAWVAEIPQVEERKSAMRELMNILRI